MLVKCGECGKEVSTNAVACPHCGNQPFGECVKCVKNEGRNFNQYERGECCHSPRNSCPGYVESFYAMNPGAAEKANSLWENNSKI